MTLNFDQLQHEVQKLKEHINHLETLLRQSATQTVPEDVSQLPTTNSPLLVATIAKARDHILSLPENWDEEGGKSFAPSTFLRAEQFLLGLAQALGDQFEIPFILPGPDASIDLHWKTAKYFLLVNIPEKDEDPITIAGEDKQQNILKLSLRNTTFLLALSAVLKPWLEMMA